MSKIIKFKHGDAIVDDDDYEWLVSEYKWYTNKKAYVQGWKNGSGKSKTHYMHKEIMNPQPGMLVDHIDRNPLNNQRSNLRIVTRLQNNMNSGPKKTNKIGYKGVTIKKAGHGNTFSYIAILARKCYGFFKTPEAAARAYDMAVIRQYDEHAYTNFPRSDYV